MKKQNPLKSQITILEYKEENLHKYHISLKLSLEVIDILNISEHYNLILVHPTKNKTNSLKAGSCENNFKLDKNLCNQLHKQPSISYFNFETAFATNLKKNDSKKQESQ